jgi:2-isopropylmalate synthase
MDPKLEIESLASLLDRVELTSSLAGRDRAQLLDRMLQMQQEGYDLAAADGTLELLIREALYPAARPFDVTSFELTTRMEAPHETRSVASVTIRVNGAAYAAQATRRGPIEALDGALRTSLHPIYPDVSEVKLTDYRVRIIDAQKGIDAHAVVSIEWLGSGKVWTTMGVSEDIIEASWVALAGAVRLELMRAGERDERLYCLQDNSWAV